MKIQDNSKENIDFAYVIAGISNKIRINIILTENLKQQIEAIQAKLNSNIINAEVAQNRLKIENEMLEMSLYRDEVIGTISLDKKILDAYKQRAGDWNAMIESLYKEAVSQDWMGVNIAYAQDLINSGKLNSQELKEVSESVGEYNKFYNSSTKQDKSLFYVLFKRQIQILKSKYDQKISQ